MKDDKELTKEQLVYTNIEAAEKNLDFDEPVIVNEELPTVFVDRPKFDNDYDDFGWIELRRAYASQKLLKGFVSGVEETTTGSIVLLYYHDHRVIIPVSEMNLGLDENKDEYGDFKIRELRIINNMVGAEIDFMVLGLDEEMKSAVGSRRLAMEKKRRWFYFPRNDGSRIITVGRKVEARVVSVAEKTMKIEVFGVECNVHARDMAWEWVADARDLHRVGDTVEVVVSSLELNEKTFNVYLAVDRKVLLKNEMKEKLKRCKVQGRYLGEVTDIRGDITYVKLDIGVNAVAHKCTDRRYPGKHDKVSFLVTVLDEEQNLVLGIITKIIRQHI